MTPDFRSWHRRQLQHLIALWGYAEAGETRLPIGLQVQCRAFDEATMFRVARMFEANTKYSGTRPPAAAASR